jgi:hypothetical protein
MTRRRVMLAIALSAAVVIAAVYLHDPPWVGNLTFGLREWENDPSGVRFRWTSGHGTFFIPSDAATMTLPLRSFFPAVDRTPVVVAVLVDDRRLADLTLTDPQAWTRPELPIPQRPTSRRYRRVDVHVARTVGFFNYGVQLGVVELSGRR